VLEALIAALRHGNQAAVRRLFAPHALVTIGLEQGSLETFLPDLEGKLDVTVRAAPRLYQLGGRVHVVLTLRLHELGAPAGRFVEGHVHVVLMRKQAVRKVRDHEASWIIASLRCRRAGIPARREERSGWRSVRPRRA
jgi:hypothetical protein